MSTPNNPYAYSADAISNKWQPIETAPKDGSEIIAYRADAGSFIVRWDEAVSFMTEREIEASDMSEDDLFEPCWFFADFIQGDRLQDDEMFTHWMPLPDPPEDT